MIHSTVRLPRRRPDLVARRRDDGAGSVIKDPRTGRFFELEAEESFLLDQLNGRLSSSQVRENFEKQFDSALEPEDLGEFLDLAAHYGLLSPDSSDSVSQSHVSQPIEAAPKPVDTAAQPESLSGAHQNANEQTSSASLLRGQSILYWRIRLVDPDAVLTWLAPRLAFLWTPAFCLLTSLSVVAAIWVMVENHYRFASSFSVALNPSAAIAAWMALAGATLMHEMAHGLTCKKFGGEVRDMGFLMMFFLPCVYCNVSDAWLLEKKSQRLWVTAAGVVCDLLLWSIAIIVWSCTYQDSLINFVAWLLATLATARVVFNLNPFLKLDGYYLLCDALGEPNLRARGVGYFQAWVRTVFWGGPIPDEEKRGAFLFVYGALCWLISTLIVAVLLWGLALGLRLFLGNFAFVVAAIVGAKAVGPLCFGFVAGDLSTMLTEKRGRTTLWCIAVVAAAVAMLVPIPDSASGAFELRSTFRAETHTEADCFVARVLVSEGQEVIEGQLLAQLTIPGLAEQVSQREAALSEAKAELALLLAGPSKEQVDAQQQRVRTAREWRDAARHALDKQTQVLKSELNQLQLRLQQEEAELEFSDTHLALLEDVRKRGNVSRMELLQARKQAMLASARCRITASELSARAAQGTLAAQAELSEREKMLTDEQSELQVLCRAIRPEEINAAKCKVDRLEEELRELRNRLESLQVKSPANGVVTTERPGELHGTFLAKGELLLTVESLNTLDVVIEVEEQEITDVQKDASIQLCARSQPFETYECQMTSIAPRAETGELQSTVKVYARLIDESELRPGMSGLAKIDCGNKQLGTWLMTRIRRALRTSWW